jgi:4TM region of DNA translocase FtsK/SpoIIIE
VSSHTFSPEHVRRSETVAGVALFLAAVAAVIVFFPSEGLVLGPTHDAVQALLGSASFVVPLGLALVSALSFTRRARPDAVPPKRRLAGLVVLALALLPSERLLGQSTGLVGDWLTEFLFDLIGGPLAAVTVVLLIAAGTVLVFDINFRKLAVAAR